MQIVKITEFFMLDITMHESLLASLLHPHHTSAGTRAPKTKRLHLAFFHLLTLIMSSCQLTSRASWDEGLCCYLSHIIWIIMKSCLTNTDFFACMYNIQYFVIICFRVEVFSHLWHICIPYQHQFKPLRQKENLLHR